MPFGCSHFNRHQTDVVGMTLAPPREVSGKVGRPCRGLGLGGATRPAGVGNGGPAAGGITAGSSLLGGRRRATPVVATSLCRHDAGLRAGIGSRAKHAERGCAQTKTG
jgi:hypothetical protein